MQSSNQKVYPPDIYTLGDRIVAISNLEGRSITLEGYGIYAGQCFIPDEGIMKDRFLLDDNTVLLSDDCMFMREDEFKAWANQSSLVITFKE